MTVEVAESPRFSPGPLSSVPHIFLLSTEPRLPGLATPSQKSEGVIVQNHSQVPDVLEGQKASSVWDPENLNLASNVLRSFFDGFDERQKLMSCSFLQIWGLTLNMVF